MFAYFFIMQALISKNKIVYKHHTQLVTYIVCGKLEFLCLIITNKYKKG